MAESMTPAKDVMVRAEDGWALPAGRLLGVLPLACDE